VDNLTHTLAGLVLADAALAAASKRSQGPPSQAFRDATFAVSVLANNFPDLDFLYAGITSGKLGYLLHHRGHTHTLALAVPQSLVCYGLVALTLWLSKKRLSSPERLTVLAVALVGPLLHVAMDFSNNYGVHPFWPIDNGWYYGDLVFIIEPWLMIGLIVASLAALRTKLSRGLLLLAMLGLLVLAWIMPLIHPLVALGLTAFAGLGVWQLRRASAHKRLLFAAVGVGTLYGTLLIARHQALALVQEELAVEPPVTLLGISSAPTPGNPLCWSVLAVQHAGPYYRVRQALVAPWPALWPAESCRWPVTETTAPLGPAKVAVSAERAKYLQWQAELRAPFAELRALYHDDCTAQALLRFARVPFWTQLEDGNTLIGDVRYDREPGSGFTEIELVPGEPCPKNLPPWDPPLHEWLQH
jgi:inner membrane protein